MVKNLPAVQETQVQSLGQFPGEGNGNPLHSRKFCGQGSLVESQRVRHDRATNRTETL